MDTAVWKYACMYVPTNNISTFYVCMHTTTSLVPRIVLRLVLGSIHIQCIVLLVGMDKYIIINIIYIYIDVMIY